MTIKIDVNSTNEKVVVVVESLGFTYSSLWNTLIVSENMCRTCLRFDRLFTYDKCLPNTSRETDIASKASILSTINHTVLELTVLLLEEADT